jgi:ubiquinone/menaquinone biosynthesis C-methylase UbiE
MHSNTLKNLAGCSVTRRPERLVLAAAFALAAGVAAAGQADRPLFPASPAPAPAVTADDEADPPPGLTKYKGREIAMTMHWRGAGWLLRARREREENAERMIAELKLKPGMVVCDMGSGNGYHALKMAELVGEEGKIIAVDIQPEMLHMLRGRAKDAGLGNIETVQGRIHDPKLKPSSVDLILLVDVYHEFSHPEHMLAAMRQALKPGGQAVFVEFRGEDDWVPIKPEHKMTKAQVLKEVVPNGFKLSREFQELPWQHMLFFERDDSVNPPEKKDQPDPAAGTE